MNKAKNNKSTETLKQKKQHQHEEQTIKTMQKSRLVEKVISSMILNGILKR